jgi:hypothetical protein
MSDEEDKTEVAPSRNVRPAEGPAALIMMESVVENLKLLNYEEHFLAQSGLKPVNVC